MKKLIILGISLWICQTAIYAQNKLSGSVSDQNNAPLIGASIFLPELNKGVVSDKSGHYELNNLPNGKIKVQFSYIGHGNQVETVIMSGNPITLDVKLPESVMEAEEVVVTGGYNSTQHQNAVKIDVLKLNTLEQPATPIFMQTLTRIPGVDMITKGNGIAKPVIRGLSMNDILTLNNGVRYENYQYSSHHPLGIDEFGVSDVEVIKGPASLLYGSDAIGGVVNFIKEKPANENTIAGDYNLQLFSNSLGMTNNLGVKGASKNFFGGIRAGQKTHADYLQGGGEFLPNTRFNEMSLKSNVGFTNQLATLNLFYEYSGSKLGLAEEEALEDIKERGRKNEIFYQTLYTHLLSSQNKFYLGNFKLDVNAALQSTELTHLGEENEYEIQMRLRTLTYDTKLYFPSAENSEYIIGFQGMNQRNTNVNDREVILLPDAVTNNYSAFGLVQYTFLEKLTLQTGLRYDYRKMTTQPVGNPADAENFRPALEKPYGSFSGSLGGTYHLSEELLLRANIASAYRTPNLAELTSKGQHELRFEVGDASLKPEKSLETDLSVHYHKGNFKFDIAGFYNRVNDYIFIAPTGQETASGIGIYQYKQAHSTLYGGEAGIHFHPEQIKWLHAETTFSSVIGKQQNGDYLPFIPAHKWNVELRAEKEKLGFIHKAFFAVNSHIAFNQNNAAPDETTTKGYTLLGVNIGGEVRVNTQPFLWTLGCSNLLDTKYVNHLSTLKEVDKLDAGRNITFTLKIPFELIKK